MSWTDKIRALKSLISRTGPLWTGTRLSGYAESGPYHCGNCKWLVAPDRCGHPIVIADMEISHRDTLPEVNAVRGCCEFVEPKR